MSGLPDFCPACQEHTGLPDRGVCPWCDTPLVARARRGGWKRPDRTSRLTDVQLRALYRAHIEQRVSINALARQVYAKVGYASPGSCASAISKQWQRLGLPARDRIEQTRISSTTHGHGARDRDEQEYRRFMRALHGWNSLRGPGQERCAAVKRRPPRMGERCSRPSMEGSDYCVAHDPTRELERQASLARMRRRQPRPEMLDMGPFAAWLRALAVEHGSMRAVARLVDGPYTALCQYAKGRGADKRPKAQVSAATVARYAQAAGTSVDAIYGVGERRAA